MPIPQLFIRLIGQPSIEFHHGDGRITSVEIPGNNPQRVLLFLALQDAPSVKREILKDALVNNTAAALDNELFLLRKWLKKCSGDDLVEPKSYIRNVNKQKDGNVCFSSDCRTDLRLFREALKAAKQQGSQEALQALRGIVLRIGEEGLLTRPNRTEDWLLDLQPYRDRFERERSEARRLVCEAVTVDLPKETDYYTGRAEMAEIEKVFWGAGAGRVPIVAIMGMGGLGKTTSALEYAYRSWERYESILWVNAENQTSLLKSYVTYAHRLERTAGTSTMATPMERGAESEDETFSVREVTERSVRVMKSWLKERSNYLIVFDNLNSQVLLKQFLPEKPGGHILVTTRLRSLGTLSHVPVDLEGFTLDQGATFLEKRFKMERAEMDAIVEVSGGLPLALELSAATLAVNKRSPKWYVAKYDIHLKAAANRLIFDADGDPVDPRLYATFMSSFDTLPEAEQELLRLLAFMGPSPFHAMWLREAHEALGETLGTAIRRDQPLAVLLDLYSLCDCTHNSYQLHRIIQATIKASLSPNDQKLWMRRAVALLVAIVPEYRFEHRSLYKDLIPHLLAICLVQSEFPNDVQDDFQHDVQNDLAWKDESMSYLLECTGRYLTVYAMFEDARKCLTRRMAIRSQLYPEGSVSLVQAMVAMAGLYVDLEQHDEAYREIHRAYEVAKIHVPVGHRLWPEIHEHMAYCRMLNNELEAAENSLLLGLSCASGLMVPYLLRTLGTIRFKQQRHQDAHTLYQQAVDEFIRLENKNRVSEAFCYTNMGVLSAILGDFKRSRWEGHQALELIKQTYNEEHPAYATALLDFAEARAAEGKPEEAVKPAKQAYEIRKIHLPEGNSETERARIFFTRMTALIAGDN